MGAFPSNWENLETSLRQDVDAGINQLLTVVTALNTLQTKTNAEINADPAVAVKQLATGVKVVARQLARLSRLTVAAFDTDDTGT
jgi:hypothetical protein